MVSRVHPTVERAVKMEEIVWYMKGARGERQRAGDAHSQTVSWRVADLLGPSCFLRPAQAVTVRLVQP